MWGLERRLRSSSIVRPNHCFLPAKQTRASIALSGLQRQEHCDIASLVPLRNERSSRTVSSHNGLFLHEFLHFSIGEQGVLPLPGAARGQVFR
ncbi:hypothetical protein RRG08_033614 [Elysia crispata]|uniref:Uncharacterized protein n=1 Tax=Elysia crispata TaxID=231223 RepID=A0AAE0XQW4_9GAST|nr:hypothetical protein RRG08_033614 [Elysia crispata]